MKKIIVAVLLITVVASFSSCTKTEAGAPDVFDLSAEVKIETAEKEELNVEAVKDIINKAVEIYEENDNVKLSSEKTLYRKDISYIDLDFVKSLTTDNFGEHLELYREYLTNIKLIATEMLSDYFPEGNTTVIDAPMTTNYIPPTHIFYIEKSDDPAKEKAIMVWNGNIFYSNGEEKLSPLFPLPEQSEIYEYLRYLNNAEAMAQ